MGTGENQKSGLPEAPGPGILAWTLPKKKIPGIFFSRTGSNDPVPVSPGQPGPGPRPGSCRAQTEAHAGPRLGPWRTDAGSQVLPHTLVPGTASYSGPRYCLIPWSQVLPHTLVPGTASYPGPRDRLIPWSQGPPHTLVPGTASYPGPRDCFIPWSQGLPHTLVPSTASFSGPRSSPCRIQKCKK